MSEGRPRSVSVGSNGEGQVTPRGIIRWGSQRQHSSSFRDSNLDGGGATAASGVKRNLPVPSLQCLARDAFLYGLADGHAAVLSSTIQLSACNPLDGPTNESIPIPIPVPTHDMPVSFDYCQRDEYDDNEIDYRIGANNNLIEIQESLEPAAMQYLPASSALLFDGSFWDGILSEAARRRILSDEFLMALCSSGIPPTRLELRGGLSDVGVTDRFLVRDAANAAFSPTTFGSASEMIISSLQHFRLSGGTTSNQLGSSEVSVERLVGPNDLESFLHRIARSANDLETLTLGPGLLQYEVSNTWIGALKALSCSCLKLRVLQLHGLAFGGTGRSESGSSIGGAGAPSSVSALFESLARNCNCLEELSLSRSTGIKDRHGQALLLENRDGSMSVKNLTILDLSYTSIGPLTYSTLCNRRIGFATDINNTSGKDIRSLNLDGTSIDCSWLKRILTALHCLEKLSVVACPDLRAGPEVWDVLAEVGDSTGSVAPLTSIALEVNFYSSDILQEYNQFQLENHIDDDHLVALAAQYEMEDGIPFVEGYDSDEEFSPNALMYSQGWSCRHCTLINEDQAHRCAACNAKRYPHAATTSASQNDAASIDSSGVVGKLDFDEKPPPVYEFPSLKAYPFASFDGTFHILFDDNSEGDANKLSKAVSSELVAKIVNALPQGLSILKLSLYDGEGTVMLQSGCVFDTELVSRFVEQYSKTTKEIELKSVQFEAPEQANIFFASLNELMNLRIYNKGHMGIDGASLLDAISAGLPNLEMLLLTSSGAKTVPAGPAKPTKVYDNEDDRADVTFSSPYLKRVWIEGFTDVERLELQTPSIDRLSLVNWSSLSHLGFTNNGDHNDEAVLNKLQRLRLRNTNLSPYSIASLKLPCLQKLEVEGMAHVEDWEFGNLVDSATQSLSELRIRQCRMLGDVKQWYRGSSFFQPLSTLELSRPSPNFDMNTLQSLMEFSSLRDVAIHRASGLKGYICARLPSNTAATPLLSDGPISTSNFISPSIAASGKDERLAELLSNQASIISRIGGGAIDESTSLTSTEMLGARGIERILQRFIESARDGGNNEFGFPPTLNAFQRKLVHEQAESMNLEHESVRINTGVKVVRVRRKRGNTNVFFHDDDNNAENDMDRGEIHVESQIPPSNLERALLAAATNSQQQVTFAPTDTEDENDENMSVAGNDSDDGEEEGDDNEHQQDETDAAAIPSTPPKRARSRRELRKAKKAEKRGEVYVFDDDADGNKGRAQSSESDKESDDASIAFDSLLQQERYARFDAKTLRKLVGLAHKLPRASDGRAVCVRYLRGACPYQHARDSGKCRYAHFTVKSSLAKRFAPLIDYVCGKPDENPVGGRGSSRRRKQDRNNNQQQRDIQAGNGSNAGSYGSESGAHLLEAHAGTGRGRGTRRRRRTRSVGTEDDDDDHQTASEDGMSSRGSSPGRGPRSPGAQSWQDESSSILLSSSPRASFSSPRGGTFAAPISVNRLLRLEVTDCEGLTGASISGDSLVRVAIKNCSMFLTLDLRAPKLTTLDVSDCKILSDFPLHDDSLRGLRVATIVGCQALNESFCSRLVNHCRALRQLHIFGSGASGKASNTRTRQRVKTKAGLNKLTAGRPKLTVIKTKKEWQVLNSKREEIAGAAEENADGDFH